MRKRLLAELADLLWKPQVSRRSIVVGLSVLILGLTVLPVMTVAQTLNDVTSQVTLKKSGLVYNRQTGSFNCLVTITNSSAATINGPLVLVISNITSGVSLGNPAGQVSFAQPYVNVPVPAGGLLPGQSISNVLLKFSNPKRLAFTFTTQLVVPTAVLTLSVPSAVTLPYGGLGGGPVGSCPTTQPPITISITNSGPFPATGVLLGLTMEPTQGLIPGSDAFLTFYPSQGGCQGNMGFLSESAQCLLNTIFPGTTVVVPFTMALADSYLTSIGTVVACPDCVGGSYNVNAYNQNEYTATTTVNDTFCGGPNCAALETSCNKDLTVCENAATVGQNTCQNAYLSLSCQYNGPPDIGLVTGLEGAACMLLGDIEGEAAGILCNTAACGADAISCSKTITDQYKACLDHVWVECKDWANICQWPGYQRWAIEP